MITIVWLLSCIGAGHCMVYVLDSKLNGLGFDNHCQLCVEVSGKLLIAC